MYLLCFVFKTSFLHSSEISKIILYCGEKKSIMTNVNLVSYKEVASPLFKERRQGFFSFLFFFNNKYMGMGILTTGKFHVSFKTHAMPQITNFKIKQRL